MDRYGVENSCRSSYRLVQVLNACPLVEGHLQRAGVLRNKSFAAVVRLYMFTESSLVDIYNAKCGSLEDAWGVFIVRHDAIPQCGLLDCNDIWTCEAWQRMGAIRTISKAAGKCAARPCGFLWGVLNSQGHLRRAVMPMNRSFEVVGTQIFFVGSSLVDMYAKCGSLEDAWRV